MMKSILIAYMMMTGCFNVNGDITPIRYDTVVCEVKSIEHDVYKACENIDDKEDVIRMEIDEVNIGDTLEIIFKGEQIDKIERIGTDGMKLILE